MPDSVAWQRYLQRHIETNLPDCSNTTSRWHRALVIPVYRESATLLQQLYALPGGQGRSLVILVLNRPDSDPDQQANAPLRGAIAELASSAMLEEHTPLYRLNDHADLYVHDMEQPGGPVAAAQGVGLARKTGCDIALKWMSAGVIDGPWICCTDADATLPQDYFTRLDDASAEVVAATFPFRHVDTQEQSCNAATALYELRLHHYVLGLEYAGSPYAYHSLGSCLAVKADAYVQVRGFPKRAGAEDFYLLNKLAKLGNVARLQGKCIELQTRYSTRVPFGTGPAVASIAGSKQQTEIPLFYHPQCFQALRALLEVTPALRQSTSAQLFQLLRAQGLDEALAPVCCAQLDSMGLDAALAHCRRQGKSPEQFLRQFHQWFDAFHSLKFIHGIRDAGWPQQSLNALAAAHPQLWPGNDGPPVAIENLRRSIRRHWGWQG